MFPIASNRRGVWSQNGLLSPPVLDLSTSRMIDSHHPERGAPESNAYAFPHFGLVVDENSLFFPQGRLPSAPPGFEPALRWYPDVPEYQAHPQPRRTPRPQPRGNTLSFPQGQLPPFPPVSQPVLKWWNPNVPVDQAYPQPQVTSLPQPRRNTLFLPPGGLSPALPVPQPQPVLEWLCPNVRVYQAHPQPPGTPLPQPRRTPFFRPRRTPLHQPRRIPLSQPRLTAFPQPRLTPLPGPAEGSTAYGPFPVTPTVVPEPSHALTTQNLARHHLQLSTANSEPPKEKRARLVSPDDIAKCEQRMEEVTREMIQTDRERTIAEWERKMDDQTNRSRKRRQAESAKRKTDKGAGRK